MKSLITIISSVLLLAATASVGAMMPQEQTNDESIQIWYSPELQDVVLSFADAYVKNSNQHDLNLNLLESGESIAAITRPGHVAFVTKDQLDGVDPRKSRLNVLGREVFVPVMNSKNPYLSLIKKQGLSPKEFATLYSGEQAATWGSVLENDSKEKACSYRTSNTGFIKYLASFTDIEYAEMQGVALETCNDVLSVVQKEKNAVGFCTLSQLKTLQKSNNLNNVTIIPVDLNENNQIDYFEEIYGSVEELARGIWIGKYTGSLFSRIYAVSSLESVRGPELELIKWIGLEGQEILDANGYSILLENEQKALMASLENPSAFAVTQDIVPGKTSMGLVMLCFILGGVVLFYLILLILNKKEDSTIVKVTQPKPLLAGSDEIPGGYFFDHSHTWTFLERDGNIRIGIDSFLQGVAGSITRVDLKGSGEKVKKGETIVALIQNGKRMEIKSPLSGTIQEQNQNLQTESTLVNTSPYSEGWMYIVKPSNWTDDFSSLVMGIKYKEWIKSEFSRLKDFLASVLSPDSERAVVLQEGGEISNGVLMDLGPDIWEEFQSNFLKN